MSDATLSGTWARLKEEVRKRTPVVSLDGPGVRVRRTREGVLVDIDPAAFRRSMRTGGSVVAAFSAIFLLIPETGFRVFGAVGVVGGLALAFLPKPRDDRLLVSPSGVASRVKGRDPRDVAIADVRAVRLEREEYEVRDDDGTHTRIRWPVKFELADGVWYVAESGDRAKARAFAEDAAIALGRPFVDATSGEAVVVAADVVNLDVGERLRSGHVPVAEVGPAPAGVDVRRAAAGVEFASTRRGWKRTLPGLVFGAVFTTLGFGGAAVLVYAAFAEGGSLWAIPLVAVPLAFGAFGSLFAFAGVSSVVGESYARVERGSVVYGVRRWARDRSKRVAFAAFEDVRSRNDVHLVSDADETELGFAHLDPDARAWLAAALRAEISRQA